MNEKYPVNPFESKEEVKSQCFIGIIMVKQEYISHIVDKLAQENPDRVILFGSYDYSEPDENSDIDILVVSGDDEMPLTYTEKSKKYLSFARLISDIRKAVPDDLILHTRPMHTKFLETGSAFAQEVVKFGKVQYKKNNARLG